MPQIEKDLIVYQDSDTGQVIRAGDLVDDDTPLELIGDVLVRIDDDPEQLLHNLVLRANAEGWALELLQYARTGNRELFNEAIRKRAEVLGELANPESKRSAAERRVRVLWQRGASVGGILRDAELTSGIRFTPDELTRIVSEGDGDH